MVIKHATNEHYCNVWDALQKRARALQGVCAGNVLNLYRAVNCLGAATRRLWLMRTLNAIELISVTESLKRQLSNKKYR
jgi:hypothetical protein